MSVRAILERSCAPGGDVVWRSLYQLYLGWRQQQAQVSTEADLHFLKQLSQLSLSALSQELVSRELVGLARSQVELDDADLEGFLRRMLARIGTTRLDADTRECLETLERLLSSMKNGSQTEMLPYITSSILGEDSLPPALHSRPLIK